MDLTEKVQNVPKLKVSLCRTCLLEKNDFGMEEIYGVVNIFKDMIPIKLEEGDGLPTKICSDCLIQADQAFKFRSMCIESDAVLRQRVTRTNSSDFNSDFKSLESEEIICNVDINNESEENLKEDKTKTTMEFDSYYSDQQDQFSELRCNICGRQLENVKKFKKHLDMHKQKGTYLCGTCGKSFTYLVSLNRHKRIHDGIKPFKCKICDKSFIQSNNLKSHLICHTKERDYECNICGKKFTRDKCLRQHIKCQHVTLPDERPYVCACGKDFRDQRDLNRHKTNIHSAERK